MIRFLADENFFRPIVEGVRLREPSADIVTAQDAGLGGFADPDLLAWAAAEGRVLLTHDVQTLVGFAWDRVRAGLPMAGVAVVFTPPAISAVIDDLAAAVRHGDPTDWADQVKYLPVP